MFYLYIYLDPRRSGRFTYSNFVSFLYEPIYVGKGCGLRAYSHLQEVNHVNAYNSIKTNKIKSILRSGLTPIICVLESGPEQYILAREETFISVIGKIIDKAGPLTNIRSAGWLTPHTSKTSRTGNGQTGKRYSTVTNGHCTFRCNAADIELLVDAGFNVVEWHRPRKKNSMSRPGTANPMYGKSAIAGRKWVTLDSGQSRLLTIDQIQQISSNFVYGRTVDKNKRKRIIVRNEQQSRYMSNKEICNLPPGTEYQIGLVWRTGRETLTVQQ